MPTSHSLSGFTGANYERGRSVEWQIAWLVSQSLLVMHWWCPVKVRVAILRAFGAEIGEGVVFRHRIRVHWPWQLRVGDASWIGEGVWILNLESVDIGNNVCVSQDVLLCTGSHDRRSPTFEFDNAPIVIEDEAWVAARATVLRGAVIGRGAVVGATALVTGRVEPGSVVLAPRAARLERDS
ncbi:MAG: hypothetical protein WKF38_04400 [Candidatus Limnocylindrales bacterium]